MSTDKLRQQYPVRFNHVHFPLHPETPPGGRPLSELFAEGDIEPAQQRMAQLMVAAGLEYGVRTHTYNSRFAQELASWAQDQEGGDNIHRALYRAYFVDAANIAELDVLIAAAKQAGLDPDAARQALLNRDYQAAVDADWDRSSKTGVTGVPTFRCNDLAVVGCQPLPVLERFVKHLLSLQSR